MCYRIADRIPIIVSYLVTNCQRRIIFFVRNLYACLCVFFLLPRTIRTAECVSTIKVCRFISKTQLSLDRCFKKRQYGGFWALNYK